MEVISTPAVPLQNAAQQGRELELEISGLGSGLPEVPDDHPHIDGVVLGTGSPITVNIMPVDPAKGGRIIAFYAIETVGP